MRRLSACGGMAKQKPDPSRSFTKILESISHSSRHDAREVFRSFCRLAACALAAGTREREYLAEIKARGWSRDQLTRFSEALAILVSQMEREPFTDLLGPAYLEFGANRQTGEFYTPKTVCQLMARVIFLEPIPTTRITTLAEPACGSGGMILAAAEACGHPAHLRVTAVDVSPVACDMCFINTSLWHIPTEIIHGNSLSLEVWGYWKNLALQRQEISTGQSSGTGSLKQAAAKLAAIVAQNRTAPRRGRRRRPRKP
jgi:hypothetical protein